jgi:hypothetical protein
MNGLIKAVQSQHNLKSEEDLEKFLIKVYEDSFEKFKEQKTNLVEQK